MLTIEAGIVLEIPSPVSKKIMYLKKKYDPFQEKMPVEITVFGSSGVGVIKPGQKKSFVFSKIENALADTKAFTTSFSKIENFPNTCVYYLKPQNRTPYDNIHTKLVSTKILRESSPFPYNPHCSISVLEKLSEKQREEISKENFPFEEFRINTVSVFEFQLNPFICKKIYSFNLGS